MTTWRAFTTITSITLLSACGGGGGDSNSSPVASPTPDPGTVTQLPAKTPVLTQGNLALYGNLSTHTQSANGFVVTALNDRQINSITWSVTTGDILPLADNSQAIGFDTNSSGNAELRADVTFANGDTQQLDISLDVIPTDLPQATIRLDHAVSELGDVSLRVDTNYTASPLIGITWNQIHGPEAQSVEFKTDNQTNLDNQTILFQAPSVNQDSVIEYEVTLTFDDDTVLTDTALVLVQDISRNPSGLFTRNDTSVTTHLRPYRANSPYSQGLLDCVYNNQIEDSCSFGDLAPIGAQTTHPSIDTILDRTLVSHTWMGDNFRLLLEQSQATPELLQLFRAASAIVISYDVRPSFYWALTGAIYLDAQNFWLTPEQRDTLNTAPDPRANLFDPLSFRTRWRYVDADGENFIRVPAESNRTARTIQDVESVAVRLIYHELAHANDFFNYSTWANLSPTDTPRNFVNQNGAQSDRFTELFPLGSQTLKDIADVAYGGDAASNAQMELAAQTVADEFVQDDAIILYSYLTQYEDYAMLFETYMMLFRYDVSADVGFFDADDLDTIVWGQRRRVGDPNVMQRASYVVNRVLDEFDTNSVVFPNAQTFSPGSSWAAQLIQSQSPVLSVEPPLLAPRQLARDPLSPTWHYHSYTPSGY